MIEDPVQLLTKTKKEGEMTLTAYKLISGVGRDESPDRKVSQGKSVQVSGALSPAF